LLIRNDFAQGGKIVLLEGLFDPRFNYRAYKLPFTRKTQPEGHIVYDRQYILAVVDPAGATLFGSWGGVSGTEVASGTVAIDGDYLVQGSKTFRVNDPQNIYFRFQSVSPIFDAFSGDIKFNCALLDQDGNQVGAAIGRQEIQVLNNGLLQMSVHNIWQFPAPEWATP